MDALDYLALINSACDLYCSLYCSKYNTLPRVGANPDHKAYRKIVEACLKNDIDVSDYITVCFYNVEKARRYLTPSDFASPDYIKRYKDQKDKLKVSMPENEYNSQVKSLMKVMLKKGLYATEEDLLIDSGAPFSAWFRVLYPDPFNARLCEIYGDLAWKELNQNKPLKEYMRNIRSSQVYCLERHVAFLPD